MTKLKTKSAGYTTQTYARAGYAVIFLTFGIFGGWAATAPLDSAVVAQGTVGVESNRKLVQHLEGGIVEQIFVTEGAIVEEGDILVKLSDIQASSNVAVLTSRRNIARATEVRLLAERALQDELSFPKDIDSNTSLVIQAVREDQRRTFEERRNILKSQIDILNNRIAQFNEEKKGLHAQEEAYKRRLVILEDQLERLKGGQKQGVVQTNLLAEKESDFIEIQTNLAQVAIQIAKADTAISEAELQIIQVKQEYSGRADGELKDVRQQLIEIREQLVVASNILTRTEVRAPVDGSVQNLRVHTAGGVISPGTVLMEIVPQGDDLIINAQINPVDIDNVHAEQHTEIRFPSFSGHWTPVLFGKVQTVSGDVITPESPNQPPYFLARIAVPDNDVPDDIRSRVTAGMPAEVIMATGERTLLDYLISPLADAVRKSLRER